MTLETGILGALFIGAGFLVIYIVSGDVTHHPTTRDMAFFGGIVIAAAGMVLLVTA